MLESLSSSIPARKHSFPHHNNNTTSSCDTAPGIGPDSRPQADFELPDRKKPHDSAVRYVYRFIVGPTSMRNLRGPKTRSCETNRSITKASYEVVAQYRRRSTTGLRAMDGAAPPQDIQNQARSPRLDVRTKATKDRVQGSQLHEVFVELCASLPDHFRVSLVHIEQAPVVEWLRDPLSLSSIQNVSRDGLRAFKCSATRPKPTMSIALISDMNNLFFEASTLLTCGCHRQARVSTDKRMQPMPRSKRARRRPHTVLLHSVQ
ncbi:uncharacterized protein SRS1_14943 [Sporisorium reilianum f. sp. reilianum]|uniref:Uncharacterized protein n=1 Tax=Sporisorium reilianum f. sp. reilianum TaxID=72559 RepID=A0A2N8UH58_9BASI|nr:uncharacterized protein SRS1_14943 [Sporisorium reilianum f. sp. reilianum]